MADPGATEVPPGHDPKKMVPLSLVKVAFWDGTHREVRIGNLTSSGTVTAFPRDANGNPDPNSEVAEVQHELGVKRPGEVQLSLGVHHDGRCTPYFEQHVRGSRTAGPPGGSGTAGRQASSTRQGVLTPARPHVRPRRPRPRSVSRRRSQSSPPWVARRAAGGALGKMPADLSKDSPHSTELDRHGGWPRGLLLCVLPPIPGITPAESHHKDGPRAFALSAWRFLNLLQTKPWLTDCLLFMVGRSRIV